MKILAIVTEAAMVTRLLQRQHPTGVGINAVDLCVCGLK